MKCPISTCDFSSFKTKQALLKHLRFFPHSSSSVNKLFFKCFYCDDWKISLENLDSQSLNWQKETIQQHLNEFHPDSHQEFEASLDFHSYLVRLDLHLIDGPLEQNDALKIGQVDYLRKLLSSAGKPMFFSFPSKNEIRCPFDGCGESYFSSWLGFKYHSSHFIHRAHWIDSDVRILIPFWFETESVEEYLLFFFTSTAQKPSKAPKELESSISGFLEAIHAHSQIVQPTASFEFDFASGLKNVYFQDVEIAIKPFEFFKRENEHFFAGCPIGISPFKILSLSSEYFGICFRKESVLLAEIPLDCSSWLGIYQSCSCELLCLVHFPFFVTDLIFLATFNSNGQCFFGVSCGRKIQFFALELSLYQHHHSAAELSSSIVTFDFSKLITLSLGNNLMICADFCNGMLVCGFLNGTLQLWNLRTTQKAPILHLYNYHFGPIKSISINEFHQIASLGQDGFLCLLRLQEYFAGLPNSIVQYQQSSLSGISVRLARFSEEERLFFCDYFSSDLKSISPGEAFSKEMRPISLLKPPSCVTGRTCCFCYEEEQQEAGKSRIFTKGILFVGSSEGEIWSTFDHCKRYKKNCLLFHWSERKCQKHVTCSNGSQILCIASNRAGQRLIYSVEDKEGGGAIIHAFNPFSEKEFVNLLPKKK